MWHTKEPPLLNGQMSKKFSSGSKNHKQTNKGNIYNFHIISIYKWSHDKGSLNKSSYRRHLTTLARPPPSPSWSMERWCNNNGNHKSQLLNGGDVLLRYLWQLDLFMQPLSWCLFYTLICFKGPNTNFLMSSFVRNWKMHVVESITLSNVYSQLQHKAYFLIQLNADSLYPFACWSLCLLCLLILMLILIESRSMLIVYRLGDRKLINAYLTKTAYKI